MAKFKWSEVTVEDVIKAVNMFESENPEYPEPRSTFLLYNGKKYPAKHIRQMAYKVHFGQEIRKADFSGGEETVRFFERLGFQTQYTHKSVNTHPMQKINTLKAGKLTHKDEALPTQQMKQESDTDRKSIKIGLYLQTNELYGNHQAFDDAMDVVRLSDIDILVLPEFAFFPFTEEYCEADFLNNGDLQQLFDKALDLSYEIGRAVVICNEDRFGTIMSIYANAFASVNETTIKYYIKHTMTNCSACDLEPYHQCAEEVFRPIIYKGYRIGLTICYDCNHSVFSRKYGQAGVDIILNSTGGNVVYDKWFKYNKVRAIENECFTFVTMGGDGNKDNPNSYVYGFTPSGKEMCPILLNGKNDECRNVPGGIYVYDTAEDDGTAEPDSGVDQIESVNKNSDLCIPIDGVNDFIQKAKPLIDGIRISEHNGMNIVMCLADGEDILKPENVLKLLYAKELKELKNKRYIIINRWDTVDPELYRTKLSVLLKVRSMENYCAVLLSSSNITKCYQCGQNRTAQVVKAVDGQFGIDLSRTGGPETIWRNKAGMKAAWRDNIEWLISTM